MEPKLFETWSRNRSRNYLCSKYFLSQFGGCQDEEKTPLRRTGTSYCTGAGAGAENMDKGGAGVGAENK